MRNNISRFGPVLLAGIAAGWLLAGCGASSSNAGGNDGEIESTSGNELSHAQTSADNNTGELNITTSTSTSTPTTGTTATSTTTTTSGQTATYTVAFTVTAAPATITATTTPTFSWTPASAVYKVYVTLAGSTTIKWGLKCATVGTNCINSPVNLGDQAAAGATVTPVGTAPAATTLAAGTYNVVVETASATGTISQAGWTAFTVQ